MLTALEQTTAPLGAVHERARAVDGRRVLIVDDIEPNRDLLRRRLARLGIHQVVEASNGREALEIIRTQAFDLVLLDIMMPIMTGFDVLEAMAAEGLGERLPVIVISAMSEMTSTVRAIELGAVDFLMKPFDPTLLRARVLSTLEKKQLQDAVQDELERKQAELAEARSLQMALTPPDAAEDWGSIAVTLQPALEIGGDLVDYLTLPDGRRLLALGDVSGKGAGAALMMARCHALVRGLVSRPDLYADVGAAAAALNAELAARNDRCIFVTMLLAVFDPVSGRLDYARCGHVPPFLRRADGVVERLDQVGGLPLGLDEDSRYKTATVQLHPGDALLLLSDGVTEATSPEAALFEEASVERWLSGELRPLADLVAAVRAFEAGDPPSDDLSALLLHLAPDA
jgi:sigma-B regulation protein RsbU (phosphoserine phosphatase)